MYHPATQTLVSSGLLGCWWWFFFLKAEFQPTASPTAEACLAAAALLISLPPNPIMNSD